jgi:hypothetical protein
MAAVRPEASDFVQNEYKGNGMSDEKKSGFDEALGPDSFSLDDYLSGNLKFPRFRHRIYLDQESGVLLNEAYEAKTTAEAEIEAANKLQQQAIESGSMGLADEKYAKLIDKANEAEEVIRQADEQIGKLEKTILSKSLTLYFRVSNATKLSSVVRKAEKAYEKKNGRANDNDIEYITGRTRAVILAQLNAYCIGVLPYGAVADEDKVEDKDLKAPPTEAQMETIVDGLISSEMLRMMMALNKGLENSSEWSDRIDAGFPGGGADLA